MLSKDILLRGETCSVIQGREKERSLDPGKVVCNELGASSTHEEEKGGLSPSKEKERGARGSISTEIARNLATGGCAVPER